MLTNEFRRQNPWGAFRNVKTLGQGSFGCVYQVEDKTEPGRFHALKKIDLRVNYFEPVLTERSVLARTADCPYIVKCSDSFLYEKAAYVWGGAAPRAGMGLIVAANDPSPWGISLLMELCDKSVRDEIKERPKKSAQPTREEVAKRLHPVLSGLAFMHAKGMAHRDVNARNVLRRPDGSYCLIDLGTATVSRKEACACDECTGKSGCMAPEVVLAKPETNTTYDATKADVWSAGILAHTFITGKDTLRTGLLANVKVDLHRAFHVKQKPISERLLRKTEDPIARDFVTQCLRLDPRERPTAAELLKHALFASTCATPTGESQPEMVSAGCDIQA